MRWISARDDFNTTPETKEGEDSFRWDPQRGVGQPAKDQSETDEKGSFSVNWQNYTLWSLEFRVKVI